MYVAPGLDLREGDKLGLLPTSYAPGAADKVTISQYDDTTGKILLNEPLEYYHWGASESTGEKYNGVDIRGEVVLLSRNIVIRATPEDDWGCQFLTADASEFDYFGEETKYSGQTIIRNVEFDGCSQADSDRAAIRF